MQMADKGTLLDLQVTGVLLCSMSCRTLGSAVFYKKKVFPHFYYVVLQDQNVLFCCELHTYIQSEQSLMADHKQHLVPLIHVSISVEEI